MWKWLMQRWLRGFEKHYDYDASYMHQLLSDSPGVFSRLAKLASLASYRRRAPVDASFVARIAAMQSEDCGPCLQLTVRMAREAGVSREVIQAALDGGDDLPAPLAETYRFALAVAQNDVEDESLREFLELRYGRAAVGELAWCIATARIFPTMKRALGYAKSCSLVEIGA